MPGGFTYGHEKFFTNQLLLWGNNNYRLFPWRIHGIGVYESLIAELLLRKTTASQVLKVYPEFLCAFPRPEKLLESPTSSLENIIKPLGLYKQRVKVLTDIARVLVTKGLPRSLDEIRELPHVGIYIPNAIACFCLGERVPVIDTNVSRIYSRFFGLNGPRDVRRNKEVQNLAWQLLPESGFVEFNYALLDFGALVCKGRGKPRCGNCPVNTRCQLFIEQSVKL
ncbi:A/G-specific adenine glycosylase [Sporotomaculum syntrophicum]|uniref:A/G-specific adenine glycosylase n=1 Tax=Sporotomaculum syntrophicum TaxID=182264 RepID=A0A9D3AXK9_9FIRM|nr:hypothetical protein [Sporotomaculum syntrophicum]KAF1083758.1 A/G-specific adenine glycosylase [Sporotomaculum syntrophicum]